MFNPNDGYAEYIAQGKEYFIDFAVFKDEDLRVTNNDIEVPFTLDGNKVTLLHEPQSGTIKIERTLAITRDVDYITNGDLRADTLDFDQNYQTYLIMDLKSELQKTQDAEVPGMITLILDTQPVPAGWLLCDGQEAIYIKPPTGTKYIKKAQ